MKNGNAESKKVSSGKIAKLGLGANMAPTPKILRACNVCKALEDDMDRAPFFTDGESFFICCQCSIMLGQKANESLSVESLSRGRAVTSPDLLPKPGKIMELLNESIMGQVEAKRDLSLAISKHLRRAASTDIKNKTNLLIFGPTGSGKTEMVKTIAREFGLPIAMVTPPNIVPRGYKGGDEVDSAIVKLLSACGWDVQRAEKGIIFFDEIDKMLRKSNTADGWTKAATIQGELLKKIEGDLVTVKDANGRDVTVDTSKILFIGAGAFTDLKGIVDGVNPNRSSGSPMGFQNRRSTDTAPAPASEAKEEHYWAEDVTTAHFVEYGITPEFYGRFGSTTFTRPLTKENHLEILKSSKSPIHDHIKMFASDGVMLSFADDFYDGLIEHAMKADLGARGIATALDKQVNAVFFNIQDYTGRSVTMSKSGPQVSALPPKAEKTLKKVAA